MSMQAQSYSIYETVANRTFKVVSKRPLVFELTADVEASPLMPAYEASLEGFVGALAEGTEGGLVTLEKGTQLTPGANKDGEFVHRRTGHETLPDGAWVFVDLRI